MLKKGIWPGDENSARGKSFQKWGHRWRARNNETGNEHGCSDEVEHMFEFRKIYDLAWHAEVSPFSLSSEPY